MTKLWNRATSLKILSSTAFIGGFITVGGGLYFQNKIQANFKNQEFFQKSVELLTGYPPAQKMLGAPIITKKVEMGDWTKNYTDGLKAQFIVPIKGSRGSGLLYSWASRAQLIDSWNIDRLDLEVNDQRWTFYKTPTSLDDQKNKDSLKSDVQQTSLGPLRYINK